MLGKLKTEAVQSLVGYSVSSTGLEPAIFGFGVRSVSTLRQCIEFKKQRFCCSAAAFPASLSARSEALMLSHPLIALYIKLSISAVILLWAKCQICHLRFELVWRMIFFITSIWFESEQRWNQELTELTDSLVSDWRSLIRESKMSVLELSLRHSSWSRVQICLQTWELLNLWARNKTYRGSQNLYKHFSHLVCIVNQFWIVSNTHRERALCDDQTATTDPHTLLKGLVAELWTLRLFKQAVVRHCGESKNAYCIIWDLHLSS